MTVEGVLAALAGSLMSEAAPLLTAAMGDWRRRRHQAALMEDVVLALLDKEAEQQGRPSHEVPPRSGSVHFDAIYPKGLYKVRGPLAVELKLWSADRPASAVLEAVDRYADAAAIAGSKGLLFVSTAPMSDVARQQLAKTIAAAPVPVTFWGPEEVQELLSRYAADLSELLRRAALEPIRAALADETDWRPGATAQLADLGGTYRTQGVVLVLGAGVSIGSGLPDWDELVGALFISMVTEKLSDDIDESQAFYVAKAAQALGGDSPLLSARYLRRGIEEGSANDPVAFQRTLSKALYRSLDEEFTASPLLAQLAKLCVPLRSGPKVHAVITYNFDDLLETELKQESVQHRTVFSGREHPTAEELPIYHAHGFLPRDVDRFEGVGDGVLAFSEEGYHQLFRDPYHWTNVMQLQAFQQRTCVFIGLSITDPNLRRLLEYAAQRDDEPRHYVFLKRFTNDDLMRKSAVDDDGKRLLRPDAAANYLRVHHALQERVLRELGLKVVWFESHEDIPNALAELHG